MVEKINSDVVGSGPQRKPWPESPAHNKALVEFNITAAVSAVSLILAIVIWANPSLRKSELVAGMIATLAFFVFVGIAYVRLRLASIRYEEADEAIAREALGKARAAAEKKISEQSSGLAGLLNVSLAEMERRHVIDRHQAENAHRNSQVAMVVGLLSLLAAASAVLVLNNSASKYVLSGVGVTGAVFSAYICRTFLSVYRMTLGQLDHSSEQQTAMIELLAFDLIVDEMSSDDRKDEARRQIVTAWTTRPKKHVDPMLNPARPLDGYPPSLPFPAAGAASRPVARPLPPVDDAVMLELLGAWLSQQGPQAIRGWIAELINPHGQQEQ